MQSPYRWSILSLHLYLSNVIESVDWYVNIKSLWYVAVPGRNRTLFCCPIWLCYYAWSNVVQNSVKGRANTCSEDAEILDKSTLCICAPPPLIPTSMYLVHATLLSVYHLRDRTEPLLLHSQTLLLFMRESSSTRLQFSQLPHTSTKDTNIKSCPSCKKWCGLHD